MPALPWCDFQQAPLPLSLSFPIKELNLISKSFSGSSVACSAINLLCSQTLCPHPSWGPMASQQAHLHSRLWPGVGGRGCGDYSGPAPHPGLSNRCFLPSTPPYLPAQLSFQPIPIWDPNPRERRGLGLHDTKGRVAPMPEPLPPPIHHPWNMLVLLSDPLRPLPA